MDPEFWLSAGYAGILLISFLGGTLLPLSSEVVVIAGLEVGLSPWYVFIAAGIGNSLAILINYYIGLKGGELMLRKRPGLLPSVERLRRYGLGMLLLSWLPVLGDPLTMAAGVIRYPIIVFITLCVTLRWLRYGVLLYAWLQI
jgi:membrane protein YqaA with SNARE-associated domain